MSILIKDCKGYLKHEYEENNYWTARIRLENFYAAMAPDFLSEYKCAVSK